MTDPSCLSSTERRVRIHAVLYTDFLPECWRWSHVNVSVESKLPTNKPTTVSWYHISTCLACLTLTTPALSTPALSPLATPCWFVHSCKVHPCNMVLNCIVHSRKFSVPPMAGSLTSIAFNLRQFTKKLKYQDGRIPLCQNMFVTLTRKRWNRCCFQTIRDEKCRYQTRFCELKSALKCWYLGSSWIYEEGKGEGLWNIPTLIDPST